MKFEYKKQVSVDSLLNVHDRHIETCPVINTLKFTGLCSSKIYDVVLGENPEYLKVSLKELKSRMDDLVKWTDDILDVYRRLPEEKKSLLENVNIETLENLRNEISYEEIVEMASNINGLIEEWIALNEELTEADNAINKEKEDLEDTSKKLLLATLNKEPTSDLEELLEYYKDEEEKEEDKKRDIIDKFNNHLKSQFEEEVDKFSDYLEIVRDRNDDLRANVGELKYQLVKHCKEELNIIQPDEYLDRKYGIKEGVANIGVLFNDTVIHERDENINFKSLLLGLKSKSYINFLQMNNMFDLKNDDNNILREIRKTELFKSLAENGIHTVRYYNNQHEYKISKDYYQEKTIKQELENKNNQKLRQ